MYRHVDKGGLSSYDDYVFVLRPFLFEVTNRLSILSKI